jgi:hypothetical protein
VNRIRPALLGGVLGTLASVSVGSLQCALWFYRDLAAGLPLWPPLEPAGHVVALASIVGPFGFVCGSLVGWAAGKVARARLLVLPACAFVLAILPVFALMHDDPPFRANARTSGAVVGIPVMAGTLALERLTRQRPPLPLASVRRTRSRERRSTPR